MTNLFGSLDIVIWDFLIGVWAFKPEFNAEWTRNPLDDLVIGIQRLTFNQMERTFERRELWNLRVAGSQVCALLFFRSSTISIIKSRISVANRKHSGQ